MTDTSRPEVRSFPWARGYQGQFKMPGGGWKFVRIPGTKEAQVFPTSEAAKDAATKLVFQFMCPPIVSERVEEVDLFAKGVTAAVLEFKAGQQRQRVEDRKVFARAGQKPVIVQTKRSRLA
ncbi:MULTISPECIES: hypothetical protein [unclassified Aureimonas]|uniref:hypothetical protein n=1 Tax=unclassified Aureimonas TaxID=2615206 RepID=UPI0006F23FC0|nr:MULTISPECIES: hypothetical protein [unclassified Aureimonas]KQT52199.1 hypothetical protein ASG62_16200 [Aureimonas sp. Leaf427]KQT70569.1 hypothetical protein ASG54_21755 [Aureimonas sp. Leaf460]